MLAVDLGGRRKRFGVRRRGGSFLPSAGKMLCVSMFVLHGGIAPSGLKGNRSRANTRGRKLAPDHRSGEEIVAAAALREFVHAHPAFGVTRESEPAPLVEEGPEP